MKKSEGGGAVSGTDDLIEKITASLRRTEIHLAESGEGAYRDEPIITTARRAEDALPAPLREMRRIGSDDVHLLANEAALFVKQGEYARDFEDSYGGNSVFTAYFPTYRRMNDRQLRTYFTWRGAVRRGEVRETSLSYVFVYIYEILNLIGFRGGADGIAALDGFVEKYRAIDGTIMRYVGRWRRDMAIYYGVPEALSSDALSRAAQIIACPEDADDDALISALSALSSVDPQKSKLYKARPDETRALICAIFRAFSRFCSEQRKTTLAERVIGRKTKRAYVIFPSAVFYDPHRREDFEFTDPSGRIYRRHAGAWTVEGYPEIKRKSAELGAIVKSIDGVLRRRAGMEQTAGASGVLEKIARRVIAEYEEEARRKEAAKVEFDFSKLSQIRRAADDTAKSLIVDDEEPEEPEEPAKAEEAVVECALTDEEKEVARRLLSGAGAAKYARERGRMLSVIIDSINEKLSGEFLDNVAVYDGDNSYIIEDYAEDLKGFI